MENQLQVIVQESGLEQTKAKYLLDNFTEYFAIADEWTQKAKTIHVTSETQSTDMSMARVGRLFLREKRIAIEKARKELKEQSLREGKAIDGIANVLKALIVPIEEYLEKQEKFIEFKKAAEAEALRIEAEKKAEEERIAKEKAEREEQERIRLENERLKKEAEAREEQARKDREAAMAKQRELEERARKEKEAAEKKLAAEISKAEAARLEAEEKARKEREAIEAKARAEREAEEKKRQAERAREEAERKAAAEKIRLAEEEQARLKAELAKQIECPYCHKRFTPK